jgi:hypothetical protein
VGRVAEGLFGPTEAGYWSSTTRFEFQNGDGVWWVVFANASMATGIGKGSPFFMRAVRGTL